MPPSSARPPSASGAWFTAKCARQIGASRCVCLYVKLPVAGSLCSACRSPRRQLRARRLLGQGPDAAMHRPQPGGHDRAGTDPRHRAVGRGQPEREVSGAGDIEDGGGLRPQGQQVTRLRAQHPRQLVGRHELGARDSQRGRRLGGLGGGRLVVVGRLDGGVAVGAGAAAKCSASSGLKPWRCPASGVAGLVVE